MKLNRFEKLMMNNPVRGFIHRQIEARTLLAMGGSMPTEGHALEIGCGRGVGVQIILNLFQAAKVDAFDLDPHMVELAQNRLAKHGDMIRVFIGDASNIDAPDNSYDAVFDFGIIHHIPVWQDSLKEIYRVLKPGGRFYSEEVYDKFIFNPIWKRLLKHPTKNRFNHDDFNQGIEDAGLTVVRSKSIRWFGWHIADKLSLD